MRLRTWSRVVKKGEARVQYTTAARAQLESTL
jgi:hypothetical protein